MISDETVHAIQARAHDPERRTAATALQARAKPLNLEHEVEQGRAHLPDQSNRLLDLAAPIQSLLQGKGFIGAGPDGLFSVGETNEENTPVPAPADAQAIERAETRLGFSIPPEVAQLYTIADGGFGPGGGLLSLEDLSGRHCSVTTNPFGPLGQTWAANLVMLFEEDGVPICYDLDTGRIIAWEADRIDDEESEADWLGSFIVEAEDLETYMLQWLRAEPLPPVAPASDSGQAKFETPDLSEETIRSMNLDPAMEAEIREIWGLPPRTGE